MTIGSGAVSSRDVSLVLYNNANAQFRTNDGRVHRLIRKSSGITLPNDFRNQGWRQQHEKGTIAPYGVDFREEGYGSSESFKDQVASSSGGDGWGYWRVTVNALPGQGMPASWAGNSFFKCSRPGVRHVALITYQSLYLDRPNDELQFNVFGYASGYLSGPRTTYGEGSYVQGTRTVSHNFTPSASYPYIVINCECLTIGHDGESQWGQGASCEYYGGHVYAL